MNLLSLSNEHIFTNIILFLLILALFFTTRYKKKKLLKITDEVEGYKKAFEISEDAIIVLSGENKAIYANSVMIQLLGINQLSDFNTLKELPKVKIKKEWVPFDTFFDHVKVKTKNDIYSFTETEISIGKDIFIPVNFYISKNITKKGTWDKMIYIQNLRKEKSQNKLKYRHKITNLPNQTQALYDLNALYAKTHLNENKFAIILIDIDNFTKLRSLVGYEEANKIMIKLADYLLSVSKKYSIEVYHAYPNTFLLTMKHIEENQRVFDFVEEVQNGLKAFKKINGLYLYLTASVGISIYPDSGSARSLLDNAYKALAEAESQGHGQVHLYMPEEKKFGFDELTLFNEMHDALENREFQVYYQPIVKSDTHELVAAEALIRWIHPKHGIIPPDVFIPIMEKTGFIIELGKFILEEVLKQQVRWGEVFKFKLIKVSINASMIEFETENFSEEIKKKLKKYNVDPELIVYEVTEGKAMISEQHTLEVFKKLRKLGIGISLDDFGTGYTSFSYLKKFPANTLKIDKSLVDYILIREEDQRIIQAMIELAHNLGLKVVVEGIENREMAELLNAYGCDFSQGYYFSKPLPVFEFQRMLRDHTIS